MASPRFHAAVFIPARWGSARFPGKPLHPVAGKPLLQHVWERARRAREIAAVVIATDDRRIADVARAFGAEVAMTSKRHPSGTDRVAEAARRIAGLTHAINVQGDEPLIDPRLIDRIARALRDGAEMVTAVSPFDPDDDAANPNAVKVALALDGSALYFSRSPIPFAGDPDTRVRLLRHHGIYGYSTATLRRLVAWRPTPLERAEKLEQLRALEHGIRIRVLRTRTASPGVDAPADVAIVERLLTRSARKRPRPGRTAPKVRP